MSQRKILIVEDVKSMAYMVAQLLDDAGYQTETAADGASAFRLVEKENPDLILLDLELPDMNGLDVMQSLSSQNITIPVIILTGHGSMNIAIEAMRRGAHDFLVKPFDQDRLLDAVEKTLNADHAKH